jgi:protocatechuate 3,4-dioxygenase alpha subunit
MSTPERAIPTGSQTVGPYFKIGLDYLAERAVSRDDAAGTVEIRGRVLDRDGAPVPDAMLEFWAPSSEQTPDLPRSTRDGCPHGFVRVATDADGQFAAVAARPVAATLDDGTMQSPHMLVLVFARGLLECPIFCAVG